MVVASKAKLNETFKQQNGQVPIASEVLSRWLSADLSVSEHLPVALNFTKGVDKITNDDLQCHLNRALQNFGLRVCNIDEKPFVAFN